MFKKRTPDKLQDLILRFDLNKTAYKDSSYKEESLKIEFLNPFLKLFGWDIDNEAGLAEGSKEIEYEKFYSKTRSRRKKKHFIDYVFRIGNQVKFILEAKKPSVDIEHDKIPAIQARVYGYHHRNQICILTDFEEFSIYECRSRPKGNDKPKAYRLFHCKYTEYPKYYSLLSAIIGRQAVLTGLHDKILQDLFQIISHVDSKVYADDRFNLLDTVFQNISRRMVSITTDAEIELDAAEKHAERENAPALEPAPQAHSMEKHHAIREKSLSTLELKAELDAYAAHLSSLHEAGYNRLSSEITDLRKLLTSEFPQFSEKLTRIVQQVSNLPLAELKEQAARVEAMLHELKAAHVEKQAEEQGPELAGQEFAEASIRAAEHSRIAYMKSLFSPGDAVGSKPESFMLAPVC